VQVTARASGAAPAALVAFGALGDPAAPSLPDGLVAAVAHAIDCELPAALGLPPEAADELARAALGAVIAHLRDEGGAARRAAERVAARHGAGRTSPSAPRTGAVLATGAR